MCLDMVKVLNSIQGQKVTGATCCLVKACWTYDIIYLVFILFWVPSPMTLLKTSSKTQSVSQNQECQSTCKSWCIRVCVPWATLELSYVCQGQLVALICPCFLARHLLPSLVIGSLPSAMFRGVSQERGGQNAHTETSRPCLTVRALSQTNLKPP